MKKIFLTLLISAMFLSCSEDNDITLKQVNITFTFTHNWDETEVTDADFDEIKFTNENGEKLSIEKLRYLISKVTFTNKNAIVEELLADYNLVDLTNNESLSFSLSETIPVGTYSNVKFTFGFDEDDNTDGIYPDLNTASWNVPMMLGGGYHFMQFDGKYINNNDAETAFNYHVISAIDTDPTNPQATDTAFEVNLGEIVITDNAVIEVKMDISEWFKNPNTWDLNLLDTKLMGNYDAQILMNANGKAAFKLGDVTQ